MSEHEENEGPKLGFGESPDQITTIFVGEADENDDSGAAWYTRDFEKEKNTPIAHASITGFIYGLKVSKSTYKKKDSYKLNIRLNAGKRYQIRSGLDTYFSRGFILAFSSFLDAGNDPKKVPITVAVRKGSEGNVIFCSLFNAETNAKIFVEWDGDAKLMPIVNEIQEILGVTVQTKDMVDNPDKYKDQKEQTHTSRPSLDDDDSSEEEDDDKAEKQADEIFGKQAEDPDAPAAKKTTTKKRSSR